MLRLIPAPATMAVGGAGVAAASDWLRRREAPPRGAARRPAGRPAPVVALRGPGEARAVRGERAGERATGDRRPPPPAVHHGERTRDVTTDDRDLA